MLELLAPEGRGSAQVTVQVSSTKDLASDARANVSSTVTAIIGALAKVR